VCEVQSAAQGGHCDASAGYMAKLQFVADKLATFGQRVVVTGLAAMSLAGLTYIGLGFGEIYLKFRKHKQKQLQQSAESS